jgi:hypothetical protein
MVRPRERGKIISQTRRKNSNDNIDGLAMISAWRHFSDPPIGSEFVSRMRQFGLDFLTSSLANSHEVIAPPLSVGRPLKSEKAPVRRYDVAWSQTVVLQYPSGRFFGQFFRCRRPWHEGSALASCCLRPLPGTLHACTPLLAAHLREVVLLGMTADRDQRHHSEARKQAARSRHYIIELSLFEVIATERPLLLYQILRRRLAARWPGHW